MFRFATLLVLVASALVVGQSAVDSRRDAPEAARGVPGPSSVPQEINHQGLVTVNGVRFNGTGLFKFAIVDPDTGINLWCNDDNDPAPTPENCVGGLGVVPTAAVNLSVVDGVYSVGLGDIALSNMKPVPSSVFNDNNAVLRVWFNDGVNGEQQLSPDQELTTAPYAHRAADGVPIGSIMAFHKNFPGVPALPSGWLECNGQVVSDPVSPLDGQPVPNLNGEARFLRGSNTSGIQQGSRTALPNNPFGTTGGAHTHEVLVGGNSGACSPNRVETAGQANGGCGPTTFDTTSTGHSHAITGGDPETRPVNMSVVWIMRVK